MQLYQVTITLLEQGQHRKYDDYHVRYSIKATSYISQEQALKIGQALKYKENDYSKWCENEHSNNASADIHFKGYFILKRINDNEYEYYTNDPNCD